ncbi:MAG: GTP cyclohydrolase I FolE [Deltaproteobacteria bacterium]|nr:GTP cyclohydrolase I FolE [Deltaproteobacteria bacterium]
MENLIKGLLLEIGENPEREGLLKTPARVREMYQYLTRGYREDPKALINSAIYEQQYDEMILVKDIEIYSLCEHHMLPFFGKAHVAYIPDGRIIGLSKVARLVDMFARRLQVQERLTVEIAKVIQEHLKPKGVAVVIEAKHLCMLMRGVEKQNSVAVTSEMLGCFRSDSRTREEFMDLIRRA